MLAYKRAAYDKRHVSEGQTALDWLGRVRG